MSIKKFMTGSTQIREEILEKMNTPLIGYNIEKKHELQNDVIGMLKKLFNTNQAVLLSSFSGSGLMEGAIRSCTAKKVAIFSIGNFGNVWYDIAKHNNIPADLYEIEWGGAISSEFVDEVLSTGKYDVMAITHNETSTGIANPIEEISKVVSKYPEIVWCVDAISSIGGTKVEVDKLGIDVCICSTEKALALPTGTAICTFSQKAIDRAKKIPYRGYYLDLLNIYDYIRRNECKYPVTPPLSNLYGLKCQLDDIKKEGIENRYKRHNNMSKLVKDWANDRFEVFGDKKHLSNTVTVIKNTKNINVVDLNNKLKERGYKISNGYGKLKEKTFGIGHMGDAKIEDVKELLNNIDDILKF